MKFKYFTDKDSNQSIAVNPDLVKLVRDSSYGTKIIFHDNEYIIVTDTYMGTVTVLSEV